MTLGIGVVGWIPLEIRRILSPTGCYLELWVQYGFKGMQESFCLCFLLMLFCCCCCCLPHFASLLMCLCWCRYRYVSTAARDEIWRLAITWIATTESFVCGPSNCSLKPKWTCIASPLVIRLPIHYCTNRNVCLSISVTLHSLYSCHRSWPSYLLLLAGDRGGI